MKTNSAKFNKYLVTEEPYYLPVGKEVELFESAYRNQIPVLLKGPTGCGKTRFMQYMAWKLKRPLVTVSCHDDLTASDLVGRYLVRGGAASLIEGAPAPKSLVVLEFPTMARAQEWYRSPEYAQALKVRATALDRRLIFVEGVAG